jgi:hypothetical protein
VHQVRTVKSRESGPADTQPAFVQHRTRQAQYYGPGCGGRIGAGAGQSGRDPRRRVTGREGHHLVLGEQPRQYSDQLGRVPADTAR